MKNKSKIFLLLAAGAILTGLTVSFPKIFGIFEWVSLIPLFAALKLLTKRDGLKLGHAYLYGLFYFELFYMVCFHFFLYMYPLDFTGLDNFTSVIAIGFAWLGLPFLQSIFAGFVFVIYILTERSRLLARYPYLSVIALPAIYTFHEFFQTFGWWGVPWGRLPLGQSEILVTLQTASLFGSYFVSFIILTVNALLFSAITAFASRTKAQRYALSALAIFSANVIAGAVIYSFTAAKDKNAEAVTVGLVQGNFDSREKWISSAIVMLNRHLDLTERCADEGADVVIWAETALPFNLDTESSYGERISTLAQEKGITILVGCMQYLDSGDYNSLICFNPDGSVYDGTYFKRHLVPFGEYVPMRPIIDALLPFLSELSILASDMTPGEEPNVFDSASGVIGPMICFDSIYEELAMDSVRAGAELFAIATNDSWFSDSSGIYMHTSQAVLRSIEFGRYTARSANTGYTCIISSTGRMTDSIAPLETGYLIGEVRLHSERTLYSYIGNTFVYTLGALMLAPAVYSLIRYAMARRSGKDLPDETQHGV